MDSADEVMDVEENMDEGQHDQIGEIPLAEIEENFSVERSLRQLPPFQERLYWPWPNDMRREMQQIIPGVYLGPYASASKAKLEDMKAVGLTHIVCVRRILERNIIRPSHPESFKYLVVEIADSNRDNIIPHMKMVEQFIDECLASGGKVLVHGNASVYLSPILVVGYLMARYGVSSKESYRFVESKRPVIFANKVFMAQLQEYEPIYRSRRTVPLPLPEGEPRGSVKRALESDEEDSQPKFPRNGNGYISMYLFNFKPI